MLDLGCKIEVTQDQKKSVHYPVSNGGMMALNKALCDLDHEGYLKTNFKDYRKLVRHSEYICMSCGRSARRKKNLCDPKRLYPKDKAAK